VLKKGAPRSVGRYIFIKKGGIEASGGLRRAVASLSLSLYANSVCTWDHCMNNGSDM